jgi:two-component system, sensor histidine kinase and response regulator
MHNASKFATIDSTVEITGKSVEGTGGKSGPGDYEVTISNKGKPIDDRQVAQLLKPFTLNENVLNHSVGTGMGLSICQAMLKLHGTSLKFTSHDSLISVSFTLKKGK